MIVGEAQLRVMLGLTGTITDAERAVMLQVHPQAEAAVKAVLGYDPQQRSRTELYPRADVGHTLDVGGVLDSDGTRAVFMRTGVPEQRSLQLEHLPIRGTPTSVFVDESARFGQVAGAFAAASEWTSGDDYWVEFDGGGDGSDSYSVSRSGCLLAFGAWPVSAGTVKIIYRAGYSDIELQGQATANQTNGDGDITTAYLDASPIARAVANTVLQAFQIWDHNRKKSGAGFAGPFTSEKMESYSYQLGAAGLAAASMVTSVPTQNIEELTEGGFVHYGLMRM